MNNTIPLSVLRHHVTGEAPKPRWDDPSLWVGTGVRHCTGCGKLHVTRKGLCWLCETEHVNQTYRITAERDYDLWTASFDFGGQSYRTDDFTSSIDAIKEAQSMIRCLINGIPL